MLALRAQGGAAKLKGHTEAYPVHPCAKIRWALRVGRKHIEKDTYAI